MGFLSIDIKKFNINIKLLLNQLELRKRLPDAAVCPRQLLKADVKRVCESQTILKKLHTCFCWVVF